MSVCRSKFSSEAGQYMNGHNGARFQRSQSQNDLDQTAYDDRFHNPRDLRSSASGYDIPQRDANQVLRRHPSDAGDRHRRSYDEWSGTRIPLSALNNNDVSRTSALENRQMDQKYRPPSDTSKNWDSRQHGDPRDTGSQRDSEGRLFYREGDDVRPSHENLSNVAAVNKRPSVRNDNPKNQDIINWLHRGNDGDSQPHDSGYSPDHSDLDRSASNYSRLANRTGDQLSKQAGYRAEPSRAELKASQPYPATRGDDEYISDSQAALRNSLTSGPNANKENPTFQQFRVSNPMYDAGHYSSVGEQTRSSESLIKGRDVGSQQRGYNWSDGGGHGSFTDNSRWRSAEHSRQEPQSQIRGAGYELASTGSQHDGSSQIPPPKPIHTAMSNSPAAYRLDVSEDLPPSLPPKLANQQGPLKPPHVSPGQLDQYHRSAEDTLMFRAGDHQLRVIKDDSGNQMDLSSEYAIVRKRTAQSVVPDQAVEDFGWRPEVERPMADGAVYQLDVASRSRQSPDGTLDSPDLPSGKSNLAIQPLAVGATSGGDFGKERRPTVKSSSQEDVTSTPSVRSPLSLDNTVAVTGRSEPQGGADNIDPQVNMLFDW